MQAEYSVSSCSTRSFARCVAVITIPMLVLVGSCGPTGSTVTPPTPYAGLLVQPVWVATHDLLYPTGIALDASGNLYVVDAGHDRIVKFDSTGAFVTTWGTRGARDGEFEFQIGTAHEGAIAVDAQNEILVADHTGRLQVFDPSGKLLWNWGAQGIADGRVTEVFGMALDRSGDLYVAADDQIQKFSLHGQLLGRWTPTSPSGNGEVGLLNTVTVAPDGSIWTGLYPGRIQEFNRQMRFIKQWGSGGSKPGQYSGRGIFGIAFDGKGRIWTVDNGGDRLEVYDSQMRFLGESGQRGSGPGEFDYPSYLVIDAQGALYVVESGGNRIQKLQPPI
jgi:DNA-binding beta-propeller fold protein YncE